MDARIGWGALRGTALSFFASRLAPTLDRVGPDNAVNCGSEPARESGARSQRCLKVFKDTSGKLQRLAPLPTTTPESAGLCALDALGNLIPVTDSQ